jgi:hypothetical protein
MQNLAGPVLPAPFDGAAVIAAWRGSADRVAGLKPGGKAGGPAQAALVP